MKIPFEKMFEADLIHPLDEKSMKACRESPLLDGLTDEGATLRNRLVARAEATLELYPVTDLTAPRLNRLYETVLKRLDCREHYLLFLKFDYQIKFEVTGSESDSYVITVSDTIEELSDEEILALFGQALGQIKANHVQNLQSLKILEQGAKSLPFVGAIAEKKLWSSVADWNIAAQFTIDRAALFACGSERTVASLLLKQSGISSVKLSEIFKSRIERPRQLGIYFVWLMQSLPIFGVVERIQELRRWIRSDDFKKNYPGLYFRTLLEDETCDEETFPLLEMHRLATQGNIEAIVALAEKYFLGKDLPKSSFMSMELYKAASFRGDAKSMYIFAAFLKEFFDSVDEKIIRRLQECSASRGFEPARKKIEGRPSAEKNSAAEKICKKFSADYKNQSACKTTFDDELEERIHFAFWINHEDKILAAETFSDDDETYGTAVTSSGIYGRLSKKNLPFAISWEELRRDSICQRQLQDDQNYFIVGKVAIYRVGKLLGGTMAEILFKLAKNLKG